MSNPLLTIVIATKDREEYCIQSLQSILEIPSNEIQVSIADNGKSSLISEYLKNNPDKRVVYKQNSTPMSFVHNFNNAMELAEGKYVCLIGDDDAVLPDILDIVHWAVANEVDSICSNNTISYYWPGAKNEFPNGFLEIPIVLERSKQINARSLLIKLIVKGFVNYLLYPLPKTYHGIVRRDLMVRIKELTGNFYAGLTPDIYSTVALSCIVKKHYMLDRPFSISGACASSATVKNMRGQHSGELAIMPHLRYRGKYVWDNKVPEYYSVDTVWAESGLKALVDMNEKQLYQEFNCYPLIASGLVHNRNYILKLALKKSDEWRKRNNISEVVYYVNTFWALCCFIANKSIRKIQSILFERKKTLNNIVSIKLAISFTEKEYKA